MHESGKLLYQLTCMTMRGEVRVQEWVVVSDPKRDIPGRDELEYLVYKAIGKPLPGHEPGYPADGPVAFEILVAHEWTQQVAQPVMDLLREALPMVRVRYESLAETHHESLA